MITNLYSATASIVASTEVRFSRTRFDGCGETTT